MANQFGGRWRVVSWLGMGAAVLFLGAALGAWAAEEKKAEPPTKEEEWTALFDGKSLKGWKAVEKDSFAGHGVVEVADDAIVIKTGQPFSGIVWEGGDVPKEGFEVELEAQRKQGVDIFCGLTVPVGKSHVSLVLGGWGDSVVGLSSINDRNASDNETTKIMSFKNDKWYKVRLRVTEPKIQAWVDGQKVVDVERGERKFTVYEQLEPMRPLGFFTWETEGALRNIRLRSIKAEK